MELTYMVRGGDGKEYGPVTLQQLSVWVKEGRLTGQQEVKRSNMDRWAAAKDFGELQPLFVSTTASPPAAAQTMAPSAAATGTADPALYSQMKSGGSWLYLVAVVSLINSVADFAGWGIRFVFGLRMTQMIDFNIGGT